jgi:hypothetical protein
MVEVVALCRRSFLSVRQTPAGEFAHRERHELPVRYAVPPPYELDLGEWAMPDPVTTRVYQQLLSDPLNVLQQYQLVVNPLPPVPDGTAAQLFFAAGDNGIAIHQQRDGAASLAGCDVDDSIQVPMLVSRVRGHALPVGAGAGARHQATRRSGATHDLWVTELQTGCSVLILDWGNNQYSMIHLQPSADDQFNRLGRAIIGASTFSGAAYKNSGLRSELTTIVGNTGGTPQNYILIQSMFDNLRRKPVQVIGVRKNGRFEFYRQTQVGTTQQAEHLAWSGWYSLVPYRSY